MAPSSSGPGRQVLILKIAGSTPAGVTKHKHNEDILAGVFLFANFCRTSPQTKY